MNGIRYLANVLHDECARRDLHRGAQAPAAVGSAENDHRDLPAPLDDARRACADVAVALRRALEKEVFLAVVPVVEAVCGRVEQLVAVVLQIRRPLG